MLGGTMDKKSGPGVLQTDLNGPCPDARPISIRLLGPGFEFRVLVGPFFSFSLKSLSLFSFTTGVVPIPFLVRRAALPWKDRMRLWARVFDCGYLKRPS